MIRTVIFDIGNVLAGFAWQEYFLGFGYPEETCLLYTSDAADE